MAHSYMYEHPHLGSIRACRVTSNLIQFRSLPYAQIPRRFARSILLDHMPKVVGQEAAFYDAREYGPCSVQPRDSIATDILWNQLPEYPLREQRQSEDCLRLTMTCPVSSLDRNTSKSLPVVAFIHGGALMIGSGDRQYYDPIAFCRGALAHSKPVIFISVNYRLGALGFLHCPEAADILPSNNGFYDQILAFEWIQKHIAGFIGDPFNATAIGQSAGAASLSLHNARPRSRPLYRKAIMLSGSTTVLVTMTPEEHKKEFMYQAEKLGIELHGRSIQDVASDVINAPLDAIRNLNYCGAPCSPSDLIPEADWATMRHARHTHPNEWLESQIFCSSTYDGSISYLVAKGQERKHLARVFSAICYAKLRDPQPLLDIYQITENDKDDAALEKICQLVSDAGFYGAILSGLLGAATSSGTRSFHALFDIGNPFTRLLEKDKFSTHTWDIVSLLGGYDDILPQDCQQGIFEWRQAILAYCDTGAFPCDIWRLMSRSTLIFRRDGVEHMRQGQEASTNRERAIRFAEREGGEHGLDLLWEDVIRFFLKTGDPRYSHEATDIIRRYEQDHPSCQGG